MGYRSEVAYRIVFDDVEVMKLFLAEARVKPETEQVFKDLEAGGHDTIDIYEQDKEINFHVHGWKWYDEYDIVQAHLALLDLAREYNERQIEVDGGVDEQGNEIEKHREANDIKYAFARIGEEMEDNDTWGSDDHWDLLDIRRSIAWY